MLQQDLYSHDRPLTREGLFQLVTDEAFRDGTIDERDNRILRSLLKFLRFDPGLATTIARWSREKYRSGELGPQRPFKPLELYKRVLRYVRYEQDPDHTEQRMVLGLRKLFGITDELHDVAVVHARKNLGNTQNIPLRSVPVAGETVAASPTHRPTADEIDPNGPIPGNLIPIRHRKRRRTVKEPVAPGSIASPARRTVKAEVISQEFQALAAVSQEAAPEEPQELEAVIGTSEDPHPEETPAGIADSAEEVLDGGEDTTDEPAAAEELAAADEPAAADEHVEDPTPATTARPRPLSPSVDPRPASMTRVIRNKVGDLPVGIRVGLLAFMLTSMGASAFCMFLLYFT